MSDRVTINVLDGGVADVRLSRPDKMNACDQAMFEGIAGAITQLTHMREVRCVVLSGEGRAFSVGIDLNRFDPGTKREITARTHGDANLAQHAAWGWRGLPQPVIAAVHGFAFGAGLQIALGADIRIVAPDAQLSVMEARWGLVPDLAGFALMRGLLREDVARELTYTARRLSGEDAARLGLVTRTAADPLAEALALAREIAANSPEAVRAAKRLFAFSSDARERDILLAEAVEQEKLLTSAGHRETIAAAKDKRPPRFAD